MPGLDPGIHSGTPLTIAHRRHGMDCRVKPGNDDDGESRLAIYPAGFIRYGCTAPETCGVTSTVSAKTIGCTY